MIRKQLGRTGIMVTPVGMGTLTMGFSQKNLAVPEGAGIIYHAVKRGINFLDTAEYYDTYRYLRPALDKIRKNPALEFPVISSKSLAKDYDGMKASVENCLSALDIPAVDIFLLHEIRGEHDFEERGGAWKALQDLKEEGLLKAVGISTHHVDAALRMLRENCDVVFPLINREALGVRTFDKGSSEDRPARREEMESAIRKLAGSGIGIYTMKAFGGGNLIGEYQRNLSYAAQIPGNTSVMVGMGSIQEIDDAVRFFEGSLPSDYQPETNRKQMKVDQSDCEGCGTCMRRCVSHAIHWNENGLAEIDTNKCVHCGYCAPVCPVRAIIFL